MCDRVLRRAGILLAAGLGLALAAGCRGPSATVTGKVTYKNQPLSGATVVFMTADTKWVGRTTTGSDGGYTLSRVPLGEVKVGVEGGAGPQGPPGRPGGGPPSKMTPPTGLDLPPDAQKSPIYNPAGSGGPTVAVPRQYADPTKSGLGTTVQAGENTYDIPLK